MSALTEALDRILNWLQQYNPQAALALQPGLTYTEIEEMIKDLPIRLPPEVYELYHWRNGTGEAFEKEQFVLIFEGARFLSLQNALALYQEKLGSYESWMLNNPSWDWYSSPHWFQLFFYFDDRESGYVVTDTINEVYPVIFMDEKYLDNQTRSYTSLTSMMLTIADCYERAYKDEEGYLVRDYNKVTQIYHKYNSDAPQFTDLLPLYYDNPDELYY